MEKIIGLIDAPFTPFYENGEVNYEPIPAYAQMLAKNGMKGVFINGSSGEGYMLTEEERIKLTEAWVAAAPEGFKIICPRWQHLCKIEPQNGRACTEDGRVRHWRNGTSIPKGGTR